MTEIWCRTTIAVALNRKGVNKMRLGDLDEAKRNLFSYYSFVNERTHKSNYMGETLMAYEVADMIDDCVDNTPTIDPETLPIVRELREKLERVTAERDAAVRQLSEIEDCDTCKHRSCIPRGGFGRCKWEWNGGEGGHS